MKWGNRSPEPDEGLLHKPCSRPSRTTRKGNRPLRCRDGHLHHIGRLRSLRALDDIELDVLSLLECLESIALKRGVMDKHILPAIETNKSKPLSIVEPLHSTFRLHKNPPFLNDHAMLRDRPKLPTLTDDKEGMMVWKNRRGRRVRWRRCEAFTRPISIENRGACNTVTHTCQAVLCDYSHHAAF